MSEFKLTPEEPPPPERKKIRLTKAEAYALSMASPKKKRIAFALVGLLIAAALGNVLWYFQDHWLPFWFPEKPAAAPAVEPAPTAAPAISDTAPTAESVAPITDPTALDFLSATVWDDPQFLQGVRLFNQTLDRYRTETSSPLPPVGLEQIEHNALQAAAQFSALREQAPATVPLADYIARCQQLALAARRARNPEATATPPPPPPPPPARPTAPPEPAMPLKPGETWQDPEYLLGANLFNRALAQYRAFLNNKAQTHLLKEIEDNAFQAAKTFEAIKPRAPEGVPIADHIAQCYRLISDCRRQNLERGADAPATGGPQGNVVGPRHRPALPAYQAP